MKNNQVLLLQQLIRADENDRLDISNELHENIAQLLAAVKLHIGIARMNIYGEGISYINEAENILIEALSGVRTLATSIAPINLKALGINYMINKLSKILKEQKEVNCTIFIDPQITTRVSLGSQNILFQVTQLQIINILKCNDISTVSITLQYLDDKVHMCIYDDGTRIHKNEHENHPGFTALHKKIIAFDGSMQIIYELDNKGMTLDVSL